MGHSRIRVKALDKVRLCRMVRISAMRNNREDFQNSMSLSVEALTEKLSTLTTAYKIYEGTEL